MVDGREDEKGISFGFDGWMDGWLYGSLIKRIEAFQQQYRTRDVMATHYTGPDLQLRIGCWLLLLLSMIDLE